MRLVAQNTSCAANNTFRHVCGAHEPITRLLQVPQNASAFFLRIGDFQIFLDVAKLVKSVLLRKKRV